MKKMLLSLSVIFLMAFSVSGQGFQKPSEGKVLIYFVRVSGTGALINFQYFDGEQYLGKMNGVHYFVYECDPGEHIFWAAAENRDFIKGNLQPNATYVLEVRPTMGAMKAAVRLHQVSPDNEKMVKKVKKIMAKKQPSDLKGQSDDMAFFIKNGMERYHKIQNEVKTMDPGWVF